jgi:tetratricopeptide (TPR) repeat protein
MNGNKILGIALVLSVTLGIALFLGNRKSDTETIVDATEEAGVAFSESEVKAYITENLANAKPADANINEVLSYGAQANEHGWLNLDQQLAYGKLKIETSPAPMEGIFILREILAVDSNHIPTIETLGEMSIRSGQFDKAKKRYQKLLSLQPENEAYRSQLQQICADLGDSDCL